MSRSGRIYIGNLPDDVSRSEIKDLLYKYGRIRSIDIKSGKTQHAFAFVEFEDSRDAEDAVKGRDGIRFDRNRLRVEFAGANKRSVANRRYSVVVRNLTHSITWQQLKDHMKGAGHVCYARIERSRGVVEYETRDDMKRAVRTLDGSELNRRRIEVYEDRGRSSSRSPSISRSRSCSKSRSRSASRSRSVSRSRNGSHSPPR
ncbi:MAG: hypothetical protein KVP17_001755 [Porospora cf. gigantea B]|uniref:uncharacterized protein n=1 Tax=Porospora cf. gigantea B TaxID=2853592 RepID=UPI003571C0A6|nr:MAG: hypothetical protein KVP17_001755 [Porospora cf. gigantea B]